MRALFFDPYLDSMGGGERYMLSLVEALATQGWQTAILWDGKSVHKKALSKFGIDLGHTAYLPMYHWKQSLFHRVSFMQKFDMAFVVSEGTVPVMAAKKNIVHFQVPFHDVKGRALGSRIRQSTVDSYVANSHFTKDVVDEEFGVRCKVIYPPVDVNAFHAGRKQNVILYLARFSYLLQDKGHDVVIEAFKKMYESGVKNYRLWLAGSTEVGSDELVKQLRKQAKGYPIEITTDPPYEDVQELYASAKFFWSMSGLRASEANEPEKCEHFGISAVEAMAAGCVPLLIRKGGFREIIQHEKSGIFWSDVDDLIAQTRLLIGNAKRVKEMSEAAKKRAAYFSKEEFVKEYLQLLL